MAIFTPKFKTSRFFEKLNLIFQDSEKEAMMRKAMTYLKLSDIFGDYYEFGTGSGKTFAFVYHLVKRNIPNMKLIGFDSFEGLPELKDLDKNSQFETRKQVHPFERFKKEMKLKKVNLNKVIVKKGWFKDTLTQRYSNNKASLIFIDCNLYYSSVEVLNYIAKYDLIQNGTIMVFDDWFYFKNNKKKGDQMAFREFLEQNKHIGATEYFPFKHSGKSFIMNLE